MTIVETLAKFVLALLAIGSGITAFYKLIIEPIRLANAAYKEVLSLRLALNDAQQKIEDILGTKTTQFEEMVALREQHALLKEKHDDLQRTLNRSGTYADKLSKRIEEVSEESKAIRTMYDKLMDDYTEAKSLVRDKEMQLTNARTIFRSQGLTESQVGALLEGSLQWSEVRPLVLEFLKKHGTKQLNPEMLNNDGEETWKS